MGAFRQPCSGRRLPYSGASFSQDIVDKVQANGHGIRRRERRAAAASLAIQGLLEPLDCVWRLEDAAHFLKLDDRNELGAHGFLVSREQCFPQRLPRVYFLLPLSIVERFLNGGRNPFFRIGPVLGWTAQHIAHAG
jgi:hypothetical protein